MNIEKVTQLEFRILISPALFLALLVASFQINSLAEAEPTGITSEENKPNTSYECKPLAKGKTVRSSRALLDKNGKPNFSSSKKQCVSPENNDLESGLSYGDFKVQNNAWNGKRSSWDWKQCTSLLQNRDGSVAAYWTYDWGNEDSLKEGFYEWEVKSYPRILYGISSETSYEDNCEKSGLPLRFSNLPQFDIEYSFSSTETQKRKGDFGDEAKNPIPVTGGERNAAITAQFYDSCDQPIETVGLAAFRIMIWVESGRERTPTGGSPFSTFTDSYNQKFNVYIKTEWGDDSYIGFSLIKDKKAGKLRLNDFINYVKKNYKELQVVELEDKWCLANIMFGTEIWWGEGSVTVHKFDITRRY